MRTITLLVLALLPALGQAPRFKVIPGLKHSSITLATSFDPLSAKEVTWSQKTIKGEFWQVAKIQNGAMTSVLHERCYQTYNGTRLVINNLNETDNGVYRAEATLGDGTVEEEYFTVTAYDPVPQPQIIPHLKRIGDQYNVTLQCSVPLNTSDVSYTWKYGLQGSENWSTVNDTSSIQMMRTPDQNMEFVCTVHNPADRKEVSFYCEQCSEGKEKRSRFPMIVYILVVCTVFAVITITALGVMFAIQKCRKTSSSKNGQELTNLTNPVQDTDSQESKIFHIVHEKNGMKNKESDEERSKLNDKPSCNHSSVIKIESLEEQEESSEEQKVSEVDFPEERKEESTEELE
ncbi:SLAM family member 5-like isoform X2 [Hyla sarda]|uniref:SLAM family member 5-like isoform X2 n=1 Tax=Hyla sarda TaxID=327740 RepID=UPI0024C21CBA|nr:SLAM family member 5-like isoform X2 [Hyla sarda]